MKEGLWFKCKYCKNPKDPKGKFACRTPFSVETILPPRGHVSKKSHQDNVAAASKVAGSALKDLFAKAEVNPQPDMTSKASASTKDEEQPKQKPQ